MSDWSSGYVVDVSYTHGFYKELAPSHLSFAALLQGFAAPGSGTEPLAYCELGCGQGVTTNLLAAANPHIRFHAADFNPAHVAGARDLARAAGLTNVQFHEQSFAEFLDNRDLPEFDIVALHGIYSWISPENRRVIVRFLREKLKPGGLAYVSYNAMPGWAPILPLRHLLNEYAQAQASGPILRRVGESIAFMERLAEAEPRYFAVNPRASEHFKDLKNRSRAYVAHEYFNRYFTPFFFADMARDMAEAKLSWAASAAVLDNVDPVNLSPEQQKLLGTIDDIALRQTVRDHMVNQQFRRDIFLKGTAGLSRPALNERWLDTRFALVGPASAATRTIRAPRGEIELQSEIYDPIVGALGEEARTLRQLLEDPALAKIGIGHVRQALVLLVAQGACLPCLPADGEPDRIAAAAAFNRTVAQRTGDGDDLAYLASGVSGNGVRIDRMERLVWLAKREGAEDAAEFVRQSLQRAGHRLMREGKPVEDKDEVLAAIRASMETFGREHEPVLARLGIR